MDTWSYRGRRRVVALLSDAKSGAMTMRQIAALCEHPEEGQVIASVTLQELLDARSTRGGTRVPSTPGLRRRIKELREAAGLDRAALARRARVPFDFVKVAETRPQKTLERDKLERLMAFLEMDEIPIDESPAQPLLWEAPRRFVKTTARVGDRLIQARRAAGVSRNVVAERCGFSTTTVRNVETHASQDHDALLLARVASAVPVLPRSPLGRILHRLGFKWLGLDGGAVDARTSPVDWDQVPLGEKHDTVLSEELGVPVRQVWRARTKRGVPPFQGAKRSTRTAMRRLLDRLEEAVLDQLGDVPRDEEGAVDWTRVPFGQTPDTLLARWLGVGREVVQAQRRRFGIEPYSRRGLLDWSRLPLGKIPDTHVAAMTGLSSSSVVTARKARGVPPCPASERTGLPPAPLPASRFVVRVEPVRHEEPSRAPRGPKLRSLWDAGEQAMAVLDARDCVETDDLLVWSGVRVNPRTRAEARTLLRELKWRDEEGTWTRARSRVGTVDDRDVVEERLRKVEAEGLWTAQDLGERVASSPEAVRGALALLVEEGVFRRVPTTGAVLYFKLRSEEQTT